MMGSATLPSHLGIVLLHVLRVPECLHHQHKQRVVEQHFTSAKTNIKQARDFVAEAD
jgi:hypothetical protein